LRVESRLTLAPSASCFGPYCAALSRCSEEALDKQAYMLTDREAEWLRDIVIRKMRAEQPPLGRLRAPEIESRCQSLYDLAERLRAR